MPDPITCHMDVKKETPGKVVYAETEQSPHYQASGIALSIYIDKPTAKMALGSPDCLTVTIEPGIVETS